MNFVAFWVIAMVIIGLSMAAEEEASSENEVLVDIVGDGEVEGRTCYDCHGGGNSVEYGSTATHIQYTQPTTGGLDWLWGIGTGKLMFVVAPILGLNIAIVVLLAIILKHLKIISEGLGGFQDEPTYAYTYQTYDAGPAPYGSGYGASKPSTGYTKRTSRGAPNFASRSTLDLMTDLFEKAVEKYTEIDVSEE